MPDIDPSQLQTIWTLARNIKAGDVIVEKISPPVFMKVTGVRKVSGVIFIGNDKHGETKAAPNMKIRIQSNANTPAP